MSKNNLIKIAFSFTALTPTLYNPGPSSSSQPLQSDPAFMNLGLSYDNMPSSSDISSNFRTSKSRQDILYNEESFEFSIHQPSPSTYQQELTDVSKPYVPTSSSSVYSSSFQSFQSSAYPGAQSSSSMFYAPTSGRAEDIASVSSDTSSPALVLSGASSRSPSTGSLTVNPSSYSPPSYSISSTSGLSVNPSYSSPSYSTSSTSTSSLSIQLLSLDLLASDYVPGPLSMATNVLASSSPSSNELSSFALDILDSDLKTPPIVPITTNSGPFSMSSSISMHHSQPYSSVMDSQSSSANIFDAGTSAVTTAPSTSSSSISHSEVWRPY